ncbi:putative phosphatase [Pleurocapsa sp. PCC 7327]|uniref:HAD family hydrolase n=1 Tax=Pleurocapsa sp. PCC 7327 TaxID=118163 RepID=UPI00029F83E3|nr:HAD family hydrolase [Pleurocapsa sp. PCC 7327]AFY76130.1 putative phosphatase [Pleurocapsa sp. PCC 7327]
MKLVVFDVDGTLININKIEEDCFIRAFAEEFGIVRINPNWSEYTHVTDSGIASQILQERLGCFPSDKELSRIKIRFFHLLKEACDRHSGLFFEIPGASKIIQELKTDPNWNIAIATGCWRDPALLKLKKAEVGISGIPFVSNDDKFSREDIIKESVEKAKYLYGIKDFKKIVFVGDGIWDVKTAGKLGIPFIGIAGANEAKKLFEQGSDRVFENFNRIKNFKKVLETAQIPRI